MFAHMLSNIKAEVRSAHVLLLGGIPTQKVHNSHS